MGPKGCDGNLTLQVLETSIYLTARVDLNPLLPATLHMVSTPCHTCISSDAEHGPANSTVTGPFPVATLYQVGRASPARQPSAFRVAFESAPAVGHDRNTREA